MIKVYLDSLGCPKNSVDAERMAAALEKENYTFVQDPETADIVIVNTCAFIEDSKQESIDAILHYTELKKEKNIRLVVSGCLSERYQKDLKEAIPEIDSMIGVRDPLKILEAVKTDSNDALDKGKYQDIAGNFSRIPLFSGLSSTYLKISEGCHRQCSFCAIPSIRGPLRSRPQNLILSEAKTLIEQGFQELILVSEDTGSYGLDKGNQNLIALLEAMDRLPLTWIRLLYLFPDPILIQIAEQIRNSKHICRYLDIPLQHVSSRLLKRMNRPGNGKEYLDFITSIRKILPEIAFRSAFIIGHPGEEEKDIQELEQWLKEARLNRVGFFAYSAEESTRSATQTPTVPKEVTKERIQRLAEIQAEISKDLLSQKIGKTLKCINDGQMINIENQDYLVLRSEYDAPEIDGQVFVPMSDESQITKDFFDVKIQSIFHNHDLVGEI